MKRPIQAQMLQVYGNAAIDFSHSKISISLSDIAFGQPVTATFSFDLRCPAGTRVAALTDSQLTQRFSCFFDGQPHSARCELKECTRVGALQCQFIYNQCSAGVQPILRLYYCEQIVLEQTVSAPDTWQPTAKALMSGRRITAQAQGNYFSARALLNGVGSLKISLQEAGIVGVCLRDQRAVLFAQQVAQGNVEVTCDGKHVQLVQAQETKTIEGLDGRDVVLVVRLRQGKYAEFAE